MNAALEYKSKITYYLALLSSFFISLKLSICLVFLIPLVLIWLYKNAKNFTRVILEDRFYFLKPLYIFLLVAVYCAFFGIDPLRSLSNFPSLVFFSFVPFTIADAFKFKNGYKILAASLLAGQVVAGLYSIVGIFLPGYYQLFLGAVTQSGQLALAFMLAMGMLFYFCRSQGTRRQKILAFASLMILGLALLINLKRGPWIGVILASAIFLFIYSKRLMLSFIAATIIIFITVTPVRERVLASYEHFSISGGREAIWDIGSELALRYPLGIGYQNSYVLTKFSTEIPEKLRHFHSNLLNILVETGWLGLFVYIWWVICLIKFCWGNFGSPQKNLFAKSLGCAIISWQTAGLVEYNFGDSEVFILAMILMGLMAVLKKDAVNASESA